MKCDEIQELISTDYMDGELDAFSKNAIDSHVLQCNACLEYKTEVFKTSNMILHENQPLPVPDYLWGEIKKTLTSNIKDSNATLYSRTLYPPHPHVWHATFSFKRMASGIAVAAVFLIGVNFLPDILHQKAGSEKNESEKKEIVRERNYLHYLLEEDITVPVSYQYNNAYHNDSHNDYSYNGAHYNDNERSNDAYSDDESYSVELFYL